MHPMLSDDNVIVIIDWRWKWCSCLTVKQWKRRRRLNDFEQGLYICWIVKTHLHRATNPHEDREYKNFKKHPNKLLLTCERKQNIRYTSSRQRLLRNDVKISDLQGLSRTDNVVLLLHATTSRSLINFFCDGCVSRTARISSISTAGTRMGKIEDISFS